MSVKSELSCRPGGRELPGLVQFTPLISEKLPGLIAALKKITWENIEAPQAWEIFLTFWLRMVHFGVYSDKNNQVTNRNAYIASQKKRKKTAF